MDQIRISQSVIARIYEIRVERIMRTDVARVGQETMMSTLKAIVKENNYACIPVLNGSKLVGQISIEGYIDWLSSDIGDVPVGQLMEVDYRTLYPEEPVVTVVRELELVGLRGLPVIDRLTGDFLGVVCRCTMMEGVLAELDVDDDKVKDRKSEDFILNSIESESSIMTLNYNVEAKPLEYGGEVSSSIRSDLYRLGLSGSTVRRAAIAAYEAEMNLLSYASGGIFTLKLNRGLLNLEIEDSGPGIPDVEKAMEPGYSTAPDWVRELGFGAGMGLQNIKSCSDNFSISSRVGVGTKLIVDINLEEQCA